MGTGGPDTVRFTWQVAANAAALLATVGVVWFEKMCKVFGGPDKAGRRAGCSPRAVVCPTLCRDSRLGTVYGVITVWSDPSSIMYSSGFLIYSQLNFLHAHLTLNKLQKQMYLLVYLLITLSILSRAWGLAPSPPGNLLTIPVRLAPWLRTTDIEVIMQPLTVEWFVAPSVLSTGRDNEKCSWWTPHG